MGLSIDSKCLGFFHSNSRDLVRCFGIEQRPQSTLNEILRREKRSSDYFIPLLISRRPTSFLSTPFPPPPFNTPCSFTVSVRDPQGGSHAFYSVRHSSLLPHPDAVCCRCHSLSVVHHGSFVLHHPHVSCPMKQPPLACWRIPFPQCKRVIGYSFLCLMSNKSNWLYSREYQLGVYFVHAWMLRFDLPPRLYTESFYGNSKSEHM